MYMFNSSYNLAAAALKKNTTVALVVVTTELAGLWLALAELFVAVMESANYKTLRCRKVGL